MRRMFLALALSLLPLAGVAADGDNQALIDELRQLTDKAREQRAADRWLQRALEDLVQRYDWPWRRELLFDDFSDGDYQTNPAWQPLNGRFWVARGRGLRSRVEAASAAPPADDQPPQAQQQPSIEQALIGALLQQALNNKAPAQTTTPTTPTTPVSSGPNEIRLSHDITNAFALETEFSLETPDGPGRLALALLQGSSGRYGYRLRLQSGPDGFVELQRVRGGRDSVVDRAPLPLDPGDGARHRLAWRQAASGDVNVLLDDKPLFSVRDKAFRDGYQQLLLSLASGDLTLHSIRISGSD